MWFTNSLNQNDGLLKPYISVSAVSAEKKRDGIISKNVFMYLFSNELNPCDVRETHEVLENSI